MGGNGSSMLGGNGSSMLAGNGSSILVGNGSSMLGISISSTSSSRNSDGIFVLLNPLSKKCRKNDSTFKPYF